MRTWLIVPVIFLAVSCKPDVQHSAEKIKSLATSSADWDKDVLSASGPVLVDFSATWCGPCRAMEPTLVSLSKDFAVKTVDVDKNPQLAQLYGVESLPTLLIFVGGEVKAKRVGLTGEAALRNELRRLSSKS